MLYISTKIKTYIEIGTEVKIVIRPEATNINIKLFFMSWYLYFSLNMYFCLSDSFLPSIFFVCLSIFSVCLSILFVFLCLSDCTLISFMCVSDVLSTHFCFLNVCIMEIPCYSVFLSIFIMFLYVCPFQ